MIGKLTESSQLKGTLSLGGSSIEYEAGNGIDITDNVISNTITSYNDLDDKPTIPEPLTITTLLEQSFTFKNITMNYDCSKYGHVVSLMIYSNNFNNSGASRNNTYLLTTMPEGYRPAFEMSVPLLYFGTLMGTAWLQTNGEIYIRPNAVNDLFRLYFCYIAV